MSLYPFPNFIRSLVYTFDGVGDRSWYKNFTSKVVIQISSPMRSWAYAKVHKKKLRVLIMHLIKRSVPKYDSVWYLTAPYDIRLIRHLSQVGSKENPDRVQDRFPGSSIFDQMEIELKDLLRVHGKIRGEFDTSKISCDEVADYVMIDLKDIFR